MKASQAAPPHLAAPGAGIPHVERFVANLLIRGKAAATTRTQAIAVFERLRSTVLQRLDGLDEQILSQPVLIKRLPGLEDSSRYWSLLMVVDHLRIVNQGITGVITELGAGRLPSGKVSTADVKPSAQATKEVIIGFDRGCHDFLDAAARIQDLKTSLKFPHPWFGPMDAATWHFMIGFHMKLHLRQIDLIRAALVES
jgi:hypothetical protein